MKEQSGFFNALESGGIYDRTYDASDFANYFSLFIGSGVFINPTNQLKVVAKEGLTVTVKRGNAFIDGYWYALKEDMDIVLNPNATGYEINDLICCTLNKTNREIRINKKEAVQNLTPVNNGTIHELVLASIKLGVGTSVITNAVITDRRPDKAYCGFVEGVVKQIDETDLFSQFTAMFTEWFDTIKGKLSEDVATGLFTYIENVAQAVGDLKTWVVLDGLQDKSNYGFPDLKMIHSANSIVFNKHLKTFNIFIQLLSSTSSPAKREVGVYKILDLKSLLKGSIGGGGQLEYVHKLTKLPNNEGVPTGDNAIALGTCVGTCTENKQYPVYVGRATRFELYYNVVDGWLYCFIPDPNWWGTSVIIDITGTFVF